MDGTVLTGTGIDYFRILALHHALQLEAKGLKLSSRMSALQVAKRNFGYKGSRASIMAQVAADVVKAQQNVQPGDCAKCGVKLNDTNA